MLNKESQSWSEVCIILAIFCDLNRNTLAKLYFLPIEIKDQLVHIQNTMIHVILLHFDFLVRDLNSPFNISYIYILQLAEIAENQLGILPQPYEVQRFSW